MLQPRSDQDPLLEFFSEPGATSAPTVPPPDPSQPLAQPIVSADPLVSEAASDEVALLRVRVGRLEKSLEQALRDLRTAKSELATLVSARKDIAPATTVASRDTSLHAVSAIFGVVIGVAIGVWIWNSLGTEAVAPSAPPVEASSAKPAPSPKADVPVSQPVVEPPAVAPRVVIPAAAVTPVRDVQARDTPARDAPVRVAAPPAARPIVNYVGTLSIDADPAGDVFIDRKAVGKTPMRAENLKAGSHLVWIERDGYQRFTRVVQVPADRVTRLVADLEPSQR